MRKRCTLVMTKTEKLEKALQIWRIFSALPVEFWSHWFSSSQLVLSNWQTQRVESAFPTRSICLSHVWELTSPHVESNNYRFLINMVMQKQSKTLGKNFTTFLWPVWNGLILKQKTPQFERFYTQYRKKPSARSDWAKRATARQRPKSRTLPYPTSRCEAGSSSLAQTHW